MNRMRQIASNAEWRAWGKRDPLYGVSTWPGKSKDGPSPWTDEEFYETGRADWSVFQRKWQQYGLDRRACVEIGCGAGRITNQLAQHFQAVHALDISPDMLAYAQQNVKAAHVRFYLTEGVNIPLADYSASAVFSCHVFQHFDTLSVASEYFKEIARVLAPGGTTMIHLPIYAWPNGRLHGTLHSARKACSDLKARLNRMLLRKGVFRPMMRALFYPVDWFFSELPKFQFECIEVCLIAPKVPFVLAKRNAGGSS